MKKTQVLGLTVALVGNVALMLPETASAVITCTAATTVNNTTTCSGSGGYTQDNVNFTSSQGVIIRVLDSVSEFDACAFHMLGSKSYGMSTRNPSMTIRNGTYKDAAFGVGCAS